MDTTAAEAAIASALPYIQVIGSAVLLIFVLFLTIRQLQSVLGAYADLRQAIEDADEEWGDSDWDDDYLDLNELYEEGKWLCPECDVINSLEVDQCGLCGADIPDDYDGLRDA